MRHLFILALTLSIISCAPPKAAEVANSKLASGVPSEFASETWITDCDEENYRYRTVFGDGTMGVYADAYLPDTNCSGTPIMTSSAIANIVLGPMSTIVEGAQDIDMTGQSLSVTPKTDEILSYFRTNCGNLSWELNTPTEISGQLCLLDKAWPTMPSPTKYAIFSKTATDLIKWEQLTVCIEGQICYDGATPETRVRKLDTFRVYHPL